jgi:WhiB family transcriptional regulator, redox-sensing transcriptional regulator
MAVRSPARHVTGGSACLDDVGGRQRDDDEPMPPTSSRAAEVLAAQDYRHWRLLAACRSADPDLFFPISSSGESVAQVRRAKAICARCLVRRDCLAFALRTKQADGVWGGMSEQERRQVNRRRPAR